MKKLFLTFAVLFFTLFFSGSSEAEVEAELNKAVNFGITKSGWSEWIGVEGAAKVRFIERRSFQSVNCKHTVWAEVDNQSGYTVTNFSGILHIYDYKKKKWVAELTLCMASKSTECEGKREIAPYSTKQFLFNIRERERPQYTFEHPRFQQELCPLEIRAVTLKYYETR